MVKTVEIKIDISIEEKCEPETTKKCEVCNSTKNVSHVVMADCFLCSKCKSQLKKGISIAWKKKRDDYPEL